MSTPEVEKYRGIIKGMSQEELELIADMLPVEVCHNRIGRELQKAKAFKTEVMTALGQTEGMKQTARVIVTLACDRSCPGCCNTNGLDGIQEVNLERLKDYEEVVLTGGEPLLMGDKFLVQLIKKLRKQNRNQSIYLYTANLALDEHEKVLDLLDGITVTLHAEATDNDIRSLKYMSENLYGEPLDMRLFIDERVYDRYDLSNIRMSTWDVVRKLKWLDRCEPADNEDLLMLRL